MTMPTLIADAGTPLMWAGFIHLTVGNLLTGRFEMSQGLDPAAQRPGPLKTTIGSGDSTTSTIPINPFGAGVAQIGFQEWPDRLGDGE
jgi:hypothetical protein